MKRIILPAIALFFAISLFGQQKTITAVPDSSKTTKHTTVSKPSGNTPAEIIKAIEAKMIFVPGDTFMMGCTNEKDTSCYPMEKPAHPVILNSFYIGKFHVTQKEWIAVMGSNPCYRYCADCPVENVSWYETQIFINKLNQLTGIYYRLPTEAEWEYAAKGGNKSRGYKYAGDNNINAVGWYESNSSKQTHPVGNKMPNELGLYDMTGNVWQWCSDWFDENYYKNSPEYDPQGPRYGGDKYRVCRGGSWWYKPVDCRVSNRDRYPPDARDDDVGFRLVRD
jgi:sulfatase modifying factor 1